MMVAAVLSVFFLSTLKAFASEPTLELRPVEIRSAVVEADQTTRFGGSVSVVGRDQIMDLNAEGMAESLRRVTGVSISRFNKIGSYGGSEGGAFYIRGQGASRPGSEITIFVDGAPREVGVWQHSLLDIVNVAHAQRILVYKSPQPQAYGGVFGAVEMETLRRRQQGYETSIAASAGRYDTYSFNLGHGGKIDLLDYYIGYAYAESDGHREHSAGRMSSAFMRFGYELTDAIHAAYIFSATDNFAEDPGRVDGPRPLRDRYNTKSYDHTLRIENTAEYGDGYLVFYYHDGEAIWEKDNLDGPETPAGSSNSYWENYGFRSSQSYQLNGLELTAGLDWTSTGGNFENVTIIGRRVFEYDDRFEVISPALAALYELELTNDIVARPSAGLRYYDNSEFSSEVAPHAGLVVDGNGWQAHAAYARGVHYPGVYASGTSRQTFSELSAELMDHYEVGITLDPLEQLRLRVTAFYDDSKDLLVRTPNGLLNAGDGRVEGVEGSIDYIPTDWLRLYVGATFMDASPSDYPRAPETMFTGGANIAPVNRLELSLDAQYVGSQVVGNRRAPEARWAQFERVDSYLLANAKVRYDLVSRDELQVRLFTALENLTDTSYEYWPGYTMPGISYTFGVETRF